MSSCPPTSLFVTRPTYDLSVGGGGGGGGGGVNSFISCSPLSPSCSWEKSIREISRELHAICGSPRSRTRDRMPVLTSRQTYPNTPPLTRHLSMGCMLRSPVLDSSPTFPSPKGQTPTQTESHDPIQPVPETAALLCQRPEPSANCHRLVVRHEETPSRLNEQLARVCPLKSEDVLASKRTEAPTKYCEHRHSDTSVVVQRQTSSKTGVLYKVPLDQHKPEELFVSLVDDRLLRVCADDGTGGDPAILEEVTIPTEVPVQSLVLSVGAEDRWLYVQERSGGAMVADFSGTSAKYLPVVRENEAASLVEIFLRIPVEFDPDEVLVKTVDDRVVVTGSRRPVTVVLGDEVIGSSRASPLTIGHSWSTPGVHFVVILALPSGTENRTVSAYFAQPHQLLITGKLRPNLRRYTF